MLLLCWIGFHLPGDYGGLCGEGQSGPEQWSCGDIDGGNKDWHNPNDPDAKVAKMKDGTTHLAHKNEHAVDLETGAIVAAEIHPADAGDTTTLLGTLEQGCISLREVREDETVAERRRAEGSSDAVSLEIEEVVADKGYHSGQTLLNLEEVERRGVCARRGAVC